jgi:hypothetical protein
MYTVMGISIQFICLTISKNKLYFIVSFIKIGKGEIKEGKARYIHR